MGKDTSSDITKVGTAPLEGIRGEDLYSSYKKEADALYRRAANSAAQAYRGDLGYEVFSNPGLFTPQESEFTLGQSVYDSPMMFAPTEEAISNKRADAQPWYLQLGAGLAKATSLAATTFLNGTVGLLYGIGEAAARGEWSGLWDNDFSKALKGWNDMMEEQLVNYYSTEELNGPWYKNILTANFIGDKFIKNLGFTVGAFYGGGAVMAPLKLMGMGKNVGSAVHAVVSAVNEGSIEALNNSTDWYNLHKMQLDDSYQQGMAKALAEYEATRGILTGSMETGYKDEAYEKYKEKVAKLDQAYQSSLDRLELDRKRMGNADLLMNMPILTASNIVQFSKLMGRGYGKTKKVKDTLEETAKRRNAGALTGSKGVKIKGDVSTGYTAGLSSLAAKTMGIRGALSEGSEEMSQRIASETAGTYYSTDVNNFYKAKIDPEAEQETLNWIKAFGTSFAKTISDDSAWEEFFIGSLTGMLGMPTFSKSGIKLEHNIVSNWREAHKRRAEQMEVANKMNEIIQDPKRLNYYQSAIRRNKLQNVADAALDFNDQFTYENATHAQLISDIAMFKRAGKESDLIELVSTALDTSDENLQAIIENTTTETEDGKKVGPWIDTKGNPITNTPEGKKEMVDVINKNRENYLSLIKEYGESLDNIEAYTRGRLDEDQLEELAWIDTQISNWEKRSNSMSQEVSDVIGKIGSWYRTQIETVSKAKDKEGASHKERTALYNKLEDSLNKLNARYEDINTITSMSPEARTATLSSPTNRALVDDYIALINSADESVMSTMEKTEAITKLRDLQRLGEASEIFSKKLNEYLTDPSKQQEAHKKAVEETAAAIEEAKKGTIKENLSKAKTVKELREAVSKEENQELVNSIMQTLIDEGNTIAKNYKETWQYDRELNRALGGLGETNQTYQDAMTLWQNQFDAAKDLEEIANPNSIFVNNEEAFIESSGGDIDMAERRFQDARYALQRAMSKVNNDIKFKNRFSEEYRRPVDEKIKDKGTNKDSTGDSGTPTIPYVNPNATPVKTPSIPTGNVTAEMVAAENREANKRVETQRSLDQSQQGQRKYYRPAIPELHIEASKEGDFRPFDEVVAERESGVDFSGIYNYLRDNGAFDYVNAAKLKPGDTLGFMIDPDFNDHTIFIVDTRNNQIVGSLDESDASIARYEGLEGLIKKIRDEYQASKSSADTQSESDIQSASEVSTTNQTIGKFLATPQTKVSKIMVGRIPYSTEERSLANIPGVIDGNSAPVLGIIKNGVLTTNEKIDDRLIIKPVDMAQKEGRLYLLIPNAAGTYSPAAVRVKHFNNQEFNLEDVTVANTPMGKSITQALDRLSNATSQDDVSLAMKELAQDIYLQDIMVTWFDAAAGSGVVISKKVRKPDGTYEMTTINGQEQIKEEKTSVYFQSSRKTAEINGLEYTYEAALEAGADMSLFGQPRDIADIRKDILNTLLKYNLPLQVSTSRINETGYNNRVIKSNILTSNLREAKVIGSWFITDYFDSQGNLQSASSPASITPYSRRGPSPVGGTEGVTQGTRVTVNGNHYIVDLKQSIIIDEKTGKRWGFTSGDQRYIDIAWAQDNYGDSTESSVMTENKIITPKGEVLDRTTGQYIFGDEAQRIKDKIAGTNRTNENRAPKHQESLPIFDSTMETMITNPEEQNRALLENAFEEGGEIGYYEKDGKLYTGYLKKIGEVEVTYDSGQKDMVPVHTTKVRDKGFGREGEFGSTSEYIVVFPNGYAMTVVKRSASDSEASKLIMNALSAKPEKVLSLSTEKTQIHNPRMPEEAETELRNRQYSSESTQPSGAATTIQRENSVNNHDEEFEDELTLSEREKSPINYRGQEFILEDIPSMVGKHRSRVKAYLKIGYSLEQISNMIGEDLLKLAGARGKIWDSLSREQRVAIAKGFSPVKTSFDSEYSEKGFSMNTEYQVEDIESLITSELYKSPLFQRVLAIAKQFGITVQFQNRATSDTAEGLYGYNKIYIQISPNSQYFEQVLMHELIHSVTQGLINREGTGELTDEQESAVKMLREVFESIQGKYGKESWYGLSNLAEFVAELANPEFREFLKSQKIEEGTSLWDRIKSFFRRLFGNKLELSDASLERMLENPIKDTNKDSVLSKIGGRTITNKSLSLSEKAFIQEFIMGLSETDRNSGRANIYNPNTGYYYTVNFAPSIESHLDNLRTGGDGFEVIDRRRPYIESNKSAWNNLTSENKKALEAKGWTQEKFDSISQRERDQAVECLGL